MAIERDKRSQVLDLSAPAAVEVEFDVSEAAEVLMSICAVSDRDDHDTFDLGEEWLKARLATVPSDLCDTVDALMLGKLKVAAHLLGIVLETPKPRTFASFLERLRGNRRARAQAAPVRLATAATATPPLGAGRDRARRRGATPRRRRSSSRRSSSTRTSTSRSGRCSKRTERTSRRACSSCSRAGTSTSSCPTQPEWREAAERDAGSKRELARSHSPTQLAELATRGYQYAPAPGIRTLAFFPSWWMRPWVILWEHKGTKIFCYPIAAPAEEGASPAEVARVYKALGDEGRLKLLRRLSDGPLTLSEAAVELGVAKSTAHHHLAILRQAGFVTVRDEDDKVYSLRDDLPETGDLLAAYLGCVEILLDDRVEHPVDPAVALAVRLSLDALADVAGSLGVALGALVEAVDLELDPVEAALADQVVLQEACGVVGEPAAAEVGMDRDAADVRDPAADVRPLPEHRAGAVAVQLDDEQAALLGIALELLGDPVPLVAAAGGQERADGLVGVEVGEEVEVVRLGATERDAHGRAGTVVAPRQADGAGGERDAAEDQRQPDERRGA